MKYDMIFIILSYAIVYLTDTLPYYYIILIMLSYLKIWLIDILS